MKTHTNKNPRWMNVFVLAFVVSLTGCPPVTNGFIKNEASLPISVVMTEKSMSKPADPGKTTKAYVWLWECVELKVGDASRFFRVEDSAGIPDDTFRVGFFASKLDMTFDGDGLYLESPSKGRVPMLEMDRCEAF